MKLNVRVGHDTDCAHPFVPRSIADTAAFDSSTGARSSPNRTSHPDTYENERPAGEAARKTALAASCLRDSGRQYLPRRHIP